MFCQWTSLLRSDKPVAHQGTRDLSNPSADLSNFLVSFNAAAASLLQDCRAGTMPQGILLCGPEGIGKRAFAHTLAQTLLCDSITDRPCGSCPSCRRFKAGTHPNVLSADAPSRGKTIKVEELRLLLHSLGRHAQQPGQRVVLMPDADALTPQAQSALLKSLEEPDADTVFILTVSTGKPLLHTVRSRLRPVMLGEWPHEAALRFLIGCGIDEGRGRELLAVCEGKPDLALSLNADERYWQARTTAQSSFFALQRTDLLPQASALLKDKQEEEEWLLGIVEREARIAVRHRLFEDETPPGALSPWADASFASLQKVMQAVSEARKYRASHVSWQVVADRLLFTIAKEIYSCQWQ